MRALRVATIITTFAAAASMHAQGRGGSAAADSAAARVRERYTKKETRIRMRDGATMFTAIYAPRDTSRSYPIMMVRTPYGIAPYGADKFPTRLGPSARFQDEGFIFVYQDVRGRYESDGYYQYMTPHLDTKRGAQDVDESTDTYDTIDWLVKNVAHNNGRVGTWGISAPGFFAAAGMIDAHPAHKAASPQAPLIDWYFGDDRHRNGTLTLAQTFNFLMGFGRARPGPVETYGPGPTWARDNPDGYRFFLEMGPTRNADAKYLKGSVAFWDSMMVHPNYDAFWQKRSIAKHLKNIRPAVLLVGGWYDGEDPYGPLRASKAMDTLSAGTKTTLVVGPWSHGGWANGDNASFGFIPFAGQKTGPFYRDSVEFPFFLCALSDRCGAPMPRAIVYQTGANQWRTFDAWPPKNVAPRSLYLRANGALAFDVPTESDGADRYVSDPAKPVPYTAATTFGYFRMYPAEDQRFASSRSDVLVYQTEPLADDLTLAGQIGVSLSVATTGTDADFVVKVIDVYPNDTPPNSDLPPGLAALTGASLAGYQQLVKGEVFRARWRESYVTPKALVPNRATPIKYQLQDVFHTFKKGHRLMVQVQSSWFPLIDRNPQTFVPNINTAVPSDFKAATMTVFRSASHPSSITLPVLPGPVHP
ncbi:MAG: CocE/NonD family hydrolase [Gemmatimonadota bacterium]|nr:CocE/NonD family hydrolase [Gemmatimonadota bacterium]